MEKLKKIQKLGLIVTWRLLYLGLCDKQISSEEIIEFAVEQLEKGCDVSEVCMLAASCSNEKEEICCLLQKLINHEETSNDIEMRKLRVVVVASAIEKKQENYIDGLVGLTDLWIELGCPEDSPHVVQGRNNNLTVGEYYTAENYSRLFQQHQDWLIRELLLFKKNDKNLYSLEF